MNTRSEPIDLEQVEHGNGLALRVPVVTEYFHLTLPAPACADVQAERGRVSVSISFRRRRAVG